MVSQYLKSCGRLQRMRYNAGYIVEQLWNGCVVIHSRKVHERPSMVDRQTGGVTLSLEIKSNMQILMKSAERAVNASLKVYTR